MVCVEQVFVRVGRNWVTMAVGMSPGLRGGAACVFRRVVSVRMRVLFSRMQAHPKAPASTETGGSAAPMRAWPGQHSTARPHQQGWRWRWRRQARPGVVRQSRVSLKANCSNKPVNMPQAFNSSDAAKLVGVARQAEHQQRWADHITSGACDSARYALLERKARAAQWLASDGDHRHHLGARPHYKAAAGFKLVARRR
jgi:hypothetical protein